MSLRLAILVSGRGSNMTAILQAIADRRLDAQVCMVFSNNPDAQALETARSFNVPTATVSHKGLSRSAHEQKVLEILAPLNVDFLVLAGYMRIVSADFLHNFKSADGSYFRVINIHPSLLPAFPGAHGYEDAFAYGAKIAGITVHLVDERVDHGPILAQTSFARYADDTIDSFKSRGLQLEHKLLPEVLQEIAINGVHFYSRQTEPVSEAELNTIGRTT